MMQMAARPWIEMRLARRGVFEEGGKWKADLHGEDVGNFASLAEALKAYRKAAEKKFGNNAVLPSDADIDAAVAAGDIQADRPAPQAAPQPKREPPKPEPKQPPKPTPTTAPKPAAKPASHKR